MREDRRREKKGRSVHLKVATEWKDRSDMHHYKSNQALFPKHTKWITLYFNLNNHNVALDFTFSNHMVNHCLWEEETINDFWQKEEVRSILGYVMNNGEPWETPTLIEHNLMNYTVMGFHIYFWALAISHAWARLIT